MKKVMYLLPAVVYCGFFGYVGLRLGFGGFPALPLVYAVLLIASAIFLLKNRWWGCIPGMAAGSIMIYLFETSYDDHFFNETYIGICMIAYFAAAGLLCYKTRRGKQ